MTPPSSSTIKVATNLKVVTFVTHTSIHEMKNEEKWNTFGQNHELVLSFVAHTRTHIWHGGWFTTCKHKKKKTPHCVIHH